MKVKSVGAVSECSHLPAYRLTVASASLIVPLTAGNVSLAELGWPVMSPTGASCPQPKLPGERA